MSPNFIINNKADQLFAHAVANSQSFLKDTLVPQFPDFPYFRLSELCASTNASASDVLRMYFRPVVLARWKPPLCPSVLCVRLRVTLEQMIGTAARRVVAVMQRRWRGPSPVAQKESEPWRPVIMAAYCKVAITILVALALPFPTFSLWAKTRRFINVLPKAVNVVSGKIEVSHVLKARFFQDVVGLRSVRRVPQSAF
jgi:hypothetical protein